MLDTQSLLVDTLRDVIAGYEWELALEGVPDDVCDEGVDEIDYSRNKLKALIRDLSGAPDDRPVAAMIGNKLVVVGPADLAVLDVSRDLIVIDVDDV